MKSMMKLGTKSLAFGVAAFVVGFGGIAAQAADAPKTDAQKTVLEMTVGNTGFEPKSFNVKPGNDVVLKITRKTDETCSKEIQVPSKKLKVKLPLNKTVTVALGKVTKGEIRFGCGMQMMDSGTISVE
jgi:plastocyanin domain-containing protein